MLRIELSEKGKFIQITQPRSRRSSMMIEKYEEAFGRMRQLGGIRLELEDMLQVFVRALFTAGFDTKEILAELWAQKDNLDRDIIEALMRR